VGHVGEIAIARRLGKPVVWLHGWDVVGPDDPVPRASTPAEAINCAIADL